MLKTNRKKSIEEICKAVEALIEHLFNNHEFCDQKWCHTNQRKTKAINSNDEGVFSSGKTKLIPTSETASDFEPSPHPYKYRSKTDDVTFNNQMRLVYRPFLRPERLKESLHS